MSQIDLIQELEQESTDLALHVDVCAQRYGQLIGKFDVVDEKFSRIEASLVSIREMVAEDRLAAQRTWLAVATTAVLTLLSITGYLLATFVIK